MFTTLRLRQGATALLIFFLVSTASHARQTSHVIDPQHSSLQIAVGKRGMFSAFGHDHLIEATRVSGEVDFDARNPAAGTVSFSVATDSLRVLDPGESESDRQQVQTTMLGPTVLDTTHFPDIAFSAKASSSASPVAGGWLELPLKGWLKLHGVERASDFSVQVRVEGQQLHVRGEAIVRQTDFGITPVSAAGGTVKVKDEVKISFDIVANAR